MNVLLIIVISIIALCAIYGYWKGFIRMLFSVISLAATIVLVMAVTPYISNFLINKTSTYNNLKVKVTQAFIGAGGKEVEFLSPEQMLEAYNVPEGVKDLLVKNNNRETYENLMVTAFDEYVSSYVAKMIINSLSFIFAFLMITVIMKMTIFSLDIFTKLPIIKGINKTVGLLAGIAQGVVIVWIVFIGATIFLNESAGQEFSKMVNESVFLSFLYKTNFIMGFVDGLV